MAVPKMSYMNNGAIETIIGRECMLVGVLNSKNNIQIDGLVEGDIHADGEVSVGVSGRIRANITALICTISGSITGRITAFEIVKIEETAKAYCEIHAPNLSVARGATFKGASVDDTAKPNF